jgi:hypothetical protein
MAEGSGGQEHSLDTPYQQTDLVLTADVELNDGCLQGIGFIDGMDNAE